jgi:hypothetical protein
VGTSHQTFFPSEVSLGKFGENRNLIFIEALTQLFSTFFERKIILFFVNKVNKHTSSTDNFDLPYNLFIDLT